MDQAAGTNSADTVAKRLLANRVDALYSFNYHSTYYIMKLENVLDKIKLVELPGNAVGIYPGYSAKLDPKIRKIIEKEIYTQIHDKKVDLERMTLDYKE
mgnify:CR=1 FL=1